MKTVKLTDQNVISTIINTGNLRLDGFNVSPPWVTGDKGLKYAILKDLGIVAGDGKNSVLLITEISDGFDNFSGIIGKIWKLRGNSGSYPVAEQFLVTCIKSYDRLVFSTNNNTKVGRCVYNNKKYLAVRMIALPFHCILFSGIYSGGCTFLNVVESEVTWVE